MSSAKAFAPGNISCVFAIRKNKNPAKSGSLGLGFTVDKGVIAAIKREANNKEHNKKNKNAVYFNNKKINFPTVDSVIEKLTDEKIIVDIKSELPLGSGFGLSGASALAAAYALNKLLKLKKTKKELALIAHISEVENLTGLGDVINQHYGGFLVKYRPSYMFKAEKLPIKNKTVHYAYFSRLDTKKVISNKKIRSKINKAGLKSLNKIKKLDKDDINLKNLIKISKEFTMESGLLKSGNVKNVIKKIENNNGTASMIMLGNAVFSDKKFKGSKKLVIKDKGAHLL
ncbi:hypothetical protein HYU09_01145 [Candidatus Woesearchaeota archaeon]|nr:hypothetical protein [Candidatus Woesearchaeota archaeon]